MCRICCGGSKAEKCGEMSRKISHIVYIVDIVICIYYNLYIIINKLYKVKKIRISHHSSAQR